MTDEEPHSKLRRDGEETKVEADRSNATSLEMNEWKFVSIILSPSLNQSKAFTEFININVH